MSRWYRAYEGTVTDPKLGEVALVAECSRSVAIAVWHCLLESAACANESGVFDTSPRRIAVILGEAPSLIERVMAEMAALGMISENVICAWSRRQFESDSSTQRSRAHRQRNRNGDATLQGRCATPPYTETETETETEIEIEKEEGDAQNRAPADPPSLPAQPPARKRATATDYAFEGQVVRLTAADLARWRKSYSAIPDITAELTSIDAYLFSMPERQNKWFHAVAGMLNRKHQEAILARERERAAQYEVLSPC